MDDALATGDADDKAPRTKRGRHTRRKLVQAARTIFETHGFSDTRITDIATEAAVAYGTFYTYFSTKEAIFREVALSLQRDMISDHDDRSEPGDERESESSDERETGRSHAGSPDDGVERDEGPLDPYARIERANRRYLESYERNARLMAVLEQAALFNDELFAIRREMRRAFVDRSTNAIDAWQRDGLVDPALEPRYAASALGSMVDRFAYVWFVLDDDFEMDAAVTNLSRLWIQALGMRAEASGAPSSPPPSGRRPARRPG